MVTSAHRQREGIQGTLAPSPRRVCHSNLSENATASPGLNLEKPSLEKKKKKGPCQRTGGRKVQDLCVASETTEPDAETRWVGLFLVGRDLRGKVRAGSLGREGHLTEWSAADRISEGPWSWAAAKWEGGLAAEETLLPFALSLEPVTWILLTLMMLIACFSSQSHDFSFLSSKSHR